MQEKKIREQICTFCFEMWQMGWVAANDGNISVKLDNHTILTTPTGIRKKNLSLDELVLTDDFGMILDALPGYRPSSELKMHLRCYREREDITAVVHAHPPTATGFAAAHIPLNEYSVIETVLTLGDVPITPYATPSTEEVPDSIAPFLLNHDALLLANHGALTVGADLTAAFSRMETLELFAKISLNARLLGGAKEISREKAKNLIALRENYKLTGRHPGLKQEEV